MARKSPDPPPIVPKEFSSLREIEQAIAKLNRRIADVKALQTSRVRYPDQSIKNVESNIINTIREIFGPNSPEFHENQYHEIYEGAHYMQMWDSGPDPEMQSNFESGIPVTIAMLEGLIARLEEKKLDFQESPEAMASVAFNGLSLHSRVASVCADRYKDGHYEDAVLSAAKVLVNFVKEKSGSDLDGAPLMRTVFSRNDPVLAFNDLSDQSDMDEQEGMMHLFEGAVLALRNPRAHSFPSDSPDRALEYIAFISLLANRLEESKRRK